VRATFGILTLFALLLGFISFGWIVHASLNHGLSAPGWSFDRDEGPKRFYCAMIAIAVFGVLAFYVAMLSFISFVDTLRLDL
jgi:hypothetical protein